MPVQELLSVEQYIMDGRLNLPEHLVNYPSTLIIKGNDALEGLGNLESVKAGLFISDCQNLRDLGNLEKLEGPLDCSNCPNLSTIGRLTRALGYVSLYNTQIEKLPDNFKLEPLPGLKNMGVKVWLHQPEPC